MMTVWKKARIVLTENHLPWRGHWPDHETMIPKALDEAQQLLDAQAIYEIVPVLGHTPQGPLLRDDVLLRSLDLLDWLGSAGHLALAVCTIGPALESRSRAYGVQGQALHALLLDALGTAALEELTSQLHRHIADQVAPQGLCLGGHLSPGELDWSIQDQSILFALLQPERIGVRLNEHGLMVPLKSVSCAIPVGRPEDLPPTMPACARCPRSATCPYAKVSEHD